MKLKDLQTYPYNSVLDFIEDEDKALKFSFIRQGDEPDRAELTNKIYEEIFEWYNQSEHSGDTLITYRTAIFRKFYKKSYSYLKRHEQENILKIIKKYTIHDEDFPFEFKKDDGILNQICNPYQIGNFGIFPKGKINPKRAQSPYNDFFDLTLSTIMDFYNGELSPEDDFKKAILDEEEYFNQFKDFNDFVYENFLFPFFDDDGNLIKLSEIDNFEEYVKVSNEIIQQRGIAIINYLRRINGLEEDIDNNQDEIIEYVEYEENQRIDIISDNGSLLIKYLKEIIDLETKKKICEYTFDNISQEQEVWKDKMDYIPKKQKFSLEIKKSLFIALIIFIISSIINMIIPSIVHLNNILTILLSLSFSIISLIILPITVPVYLKIKEYKEIQRKYKSDLEKQNLINNKSQNAINIIQNNIEKLRNSYNFIDENLQELYSYGIIYKKYQTLEACTAILEYLESGRCYKLTGPHGAYNKFDLEVSMGNVISELKNINISVRTIIENQAELQYITRNIAKNVIDMTDDINNICSQTNIVYDKIDEIMNNTKISAFSSNILATSVNDWRITSTKLINKI